MSIDLEWGKLNASLATHLVEVLNRQLVSTTRPSFIGPVEVTSLEFGSVSPDLELVDLRDIYRDFLEDEDDNDGQPVKVSESAEDEDGFEWVSRRAAGRDEALAFQHLPPHIRHRDLFASIPSMHPPRDAWNGSSSLPNLKDFTTPYAGLYRSPSPATPFTPHMSHRPSTHSDEHEHSLHSLSSPNESPNVSAEINPQDQPPPPTPPPQPLPNVQLHLHVNWQSNLRITLTTSLLINYPSSMFMSLPIKLSVTGLVFTGEIAVAFEGERRRLHLCILDDLDPYGPATVNSRPKHGSTSSTPPELEDESPISNLGGMAARAAKPLPVGQRLLPSIYIESEIGQADKHVLKNVTRVERFIQDVIRKTVEEELVFPNFHTVLMGEPERR